MKVGAVTQVLEHMFGAAKGRGTGPVHALATHLGGRQGVGALEHSHGVTADAGHGHAALGHPGGRVVRTAGAKVGDAHYRGGCGITELHVLGQALLQGTVTFTQAGLRCAQRADPRHQYVGNGGGLHISGGVVRRGAHARKLADRSDDRYSLSSPLLDRKLQ